MRDSLRPATLDPLAEPGGHRTADGRPESRCSAQSSPKTSTESPFFELIWKFPPAATATYCLPSTSKAIGAAFTPAPAWNDHSLSPVAALNALKLPSASPVKTRLPLVVSVPP